MTVTFCARLFARLDESHLGSVSPLDIGSRWRSILATSGSTVVLVRPSNLWTRYQTKPLIGLRRTKSPKTSTPCKALTKSNADQASGLPPAHHEINSIAQFIPIRKNNPTHTKNVRFSRRNTRNSSRSDASFRAKIRRSNSRWYFVIPTAVRLNSTRFAKTRIPTGT